MKRLIEIVLAYLARIRTGMGPVVDRCGQDDICCRLLLIAVLALLVVGLCNPILGICLGVIAAHVVAIR